MSDRLEEDLKAALAAMVGESAPDLLSAMCGIAQGAGRTVTVSIEVGPDSDRAKLGMVFGPKDPGDDAMSDGPLDLLGRKLKVGDHVVYGTLGRGNSCSILHGMIYEIDKFGSVMIEPMEKGRKQVIKDSRSVCHIVLPDIQDAAAQLGRDPDEDLGEHPMDREQRTRMASRYDGGSA